MRLFAIIFLTIGIPFLITGIMFYTDNRPEAKLVVVIGMALLTIAIALFPLSDMRKRPPEN